MQISKYTPPNLSAYCFFWSGIIFDYCIPIVIIQLKSGKECFQMTILKSRAYIWFSHAVHCC